MVENERRKNEKNIKVVAMLSSHLSYSLPDKLREDINTKGSFTKFEESMVDEPDMVKFQRISTGISYAIGCADKQQT